MGQQVCMGALLKCSFGTAPSSLMVLPTNRVMMKMPVANIMDHAPMVNILPFGMCQSMANPAVAAAMAAMGTLTPMPCVPATPAPWAPGCATVMIANMPALNTSSRLMCAFGGTIEIAYAGQATVNIP